MTSYQYRKSHCGDKTILRPSYLHNGTSYTDKMTSLYWIRAQNTWALFQGNAFENVICKVGPFCWSPSVSRWNGNPLTIQLFSIQKTHMTLPLVISPASGFQGPDLTKQCLISDLRLRLCWYSWTKKLSYDWEVGHDLGRNLNWGQNWSQLCPANWYGIHI